MRPFALLGILIAMPLLGGAGYGGVRLSDGFAMLLFFGAIAVVGVGGLAACALQRVEAKAYLVPGIMAVIGIIGCASALENR